MVQLGKILMQAGGYLMETNEELRDAISKLTAFDKMYEKVRIIDPVNNIILIYGEKGIVERTESCYKMWCNNGVCENCISMRAYNSNDTFVKIDYTKDKIFMVMAVPMEFKGKRVVVELLKDVTNSMIMRDLRLEDNIEMKNLLDKVNLATVTDELTKIYNKRYIIEKLPVEIMAHHLNHNPLSVIMADLDFFKKINDNYGHMAGDYILKEFAVILNENIRREKDWVARFGGEEFLVCLPHAKKEIALAIAERMREAVEEKIFIYNDIEIKLTASFGVFTTEDGKISDYDSLIESADKNLYKAKQNGRNLVIGS